ncbi:hypothetical protein NT6N_24390 [Oceaniferula spumae]|uniref:DUF4145 domain-containing protein n=1 Tax=Oceaniferula spumae TaxID=2979115 RepID=A0AAT9FNB7_9BACT
MTLTEQQQLKAGEILKYLKLLVFSGRLHQEGERAAMIIGVSKVDNLLCDLIKLQLIAPKTKQDNLFDPDRPLGSFSSRITLASRMGLIDKNVESCLQVIRRIRNDFAHKDDFISYKDDPHNSRLVELVRLTKLSPLRATILEQLRFDNESEGIETSDELMQFSTSIAVMLTTIQMAIDENLKSSPEHKSLVFICSFENE